MTPDVPQVPRLTPAQIALFKQQGFLVMPSVLDPALLTAADDALWDFTGISPAYRADRYGRSST